MKRIIIYLVCAFLLAINTSGQEAIDISGEWKGALYWGNLPMRVIINITKSNDNTYRAFIDSPDQMSYNIPVDDCSIRNDSIYIVSSTINGNYRGFLASRDSISGQWFQNGTTEALDLSRGPNAYCVRKGQDPIPPFPYRIENISFFNEKDSIELSGTLTYPLRRNFPLVILISGSGPHDRNAYTLGHKPFLVIADYLARNDIGVFRYDERGVGESEGEFLSATSEDFAMDVVCALEYLKSRTDLGIGNIGLLGHSEGGIVAPLVANRTGDIDFIILMAAPGLPGKILLIDQNKRILKAAGADDTTISKVARQIETELDLITNVENVADLEEVYKSSLKILNTFTTEEKLKFRLSETSTRQRINSFLRPWYRFYLDYDPEVALKEINCPVLALNGDKDIQVHSEKNLSIIQQAMKENPGAKVLELNNINHMFQETLSGVMSEYAVIDETISESVLEIIVDWVRLVAF